MSFRVGLLFLSQFLIRNKMAYKIGKKVVIDRNCNVNARKVTAKSGVVEQWLTVCGKIRTDKIVCRLKNYTDINGTLLSKDGNVDACNIFAKRIQGNLLLASNIEANLITSETISANTLCGNLLLVEELCEKTANAGILVNCNVCVAQTLKAPLVEGNVELFGNLKITDALYVDRILECTPGNGVCIGLQNGEAGLVASTVVTDALCNPVIDASFSGDAAWQSFEITNGGGPITTLYLDMTRNFGFANTPMEAKIYNGVGTGGALLANVTEPSYNGGAFDFSSANLNLVNGFYTLQMDYPPNNLDNYTWHGRTSQPGDPMSSISDTTLNLSVFTITEAGVKVFPNNAIIPKISSNAICAIQDTILVTGNLVPSEGNVYNLGNATNKWANVYAKELIVCGNTNLVGNVVVNGNGNIIVPKLFVDELCSKSSDEVNVNANVVVNGNIVVTGNLCGNIETNLINQKSETGNLCINGNVKINGNLYAQPQSFHKFGFAEHPDQVVLAGNASPDLCTWATYDGINIQTIGMSFNKSTSGITDILEFDYPVPLNRAARTGFVLFADDSKSVVESNVNTRYRVTVTGNVPSLAVVTFMFMISVNT